METEWDNSTKVRQQRVASSAKHRRSFNYDDSECIQPTISNARRMRLMTAVLPSKQPKISDPCLKECEQLTLMSQLSLSISVLQNSIKQSLSKITKHEQLKQQLQQLYNAKHLQYLQNLSDFDERMKQLHQQRNKLYKTIDNMKHCTNTVLKLTKKNTAFERELTVNGKEEERWMRELPEMLTRLKEEEVAEERERGKWEGKLEEIKRVNGEEEEKMVPLVKDIGKAKFHISVLRMGVNKNFRMGVNVYCNKVPPEEIFSYTAWKEEKSRRLETLDIIYGILASLYPKIRSILTKTHYYSKYFQILLKGQSQPQILCDLKRKLLPPPNTPTPVRPFQPSKQPKPLIFLASPFPDFVQQFKNQLMQYLMGFNNGIIHIQLVDFHPIKESLEEIEVTYNLGTTPMVKCFYLMGMNGLPTLEQLQSIGDARRRSNLTDMIKEINGDRRGYILLQFPLMIRTEEIKIYYELNDYMKKLK